MPLPVALQLYTVRDALARDFEGTLAAVAKMGYKFVEFAGLYSRTPTQVRSICDRNGLQVIAAHVGLDAIRGNLPAEIDSALTLGHNHIVCPWVGEELRTKSGYRKIAVTLVEAGQEAAAHNISICYHNHAFEFEPAKDGSGYAGLPGMNILFDETDGRYLKSELDVFWVAYAKDDPIRLLKKLRGRVPLVHIKDMDWTPKRNFKEVGTGILDIRTIAEAAPLFGVKAYIIEQDSNWIGGRPLESARISLEKFRRIIGA